MPWETATALRYCQTSTSSPRYVCIYITIIFSFVLIYYYKSLFPKFCIYFSSFLRSHLLLSIYISINRSLSLFLLHFSPVTHTHFYFIFPHVIFSAPVPFLARLLFSPDMETVTDACWALSYLSDGPNERIQAVLNAGVAPRLVELLGSETSTVQTPGEHVHSISYYCQFYTSIL